MLSMTRSISTGCKALLAVLLLGFWMAPRPAAAHAILMESVPAINATAKGPDVAFDLRFNSRVDHKRSRLTLTLPDQSQQVLPIAEDSAEDRLLTKATLAPGTYTLRWQVLAIDGHITRGDVPFTVGGN
jgi:methionine-rich copper-binding protein CopC